MDIEIEKERNDMMITMILYKYCCVYLCTRLVRRQSARLKSQVHGRAFRFIISHKLSCTLHACFDSDVQVL